MHRFKIDFNDSGHFPFALFCRRPCWHRFITGLTRWENIEYFKTRDEAVALYEQIKALPEYLD